MKLKLKYKLLLVLALLGCWALTGFENPIDFFASKKGYRRFSMSNSAEVIAMANTRDDGSIWDITGRADRPEFVIKLIKVGDEVTGILLYEIGTGDVTEVGIEVEI